jgi:PhzF family phenazine biosynthesis protein
MELPIYHIDTFTDKIFSGNPAGVCLLSEWLPDELMQSIAAENHLPATSFVISKDEKHEVRSFTPTEELSLCGHGSLAAAYVLLRWIYPWLDEIKLETKTGHVTIIKQQDAYLLNLPAHPAFPADMPEGLALALGGIEPRFFFKNDKFHMAVVESERQVRQLKPNLYKLNEMGLKKLIVTAPGDRMDFVSRFFIPMGLIQEDPVTGSSHCTLMPYWARRLNKPRLQAQQVSQRGGSLICELKQDRVIIKASAYSQGTMTLRV